MVWNHADRLKLLGIIENRPWHWNKLDFYYTDNDYKDNDFKEIAELMGKSVEDCQRNWRSMKVCYYRMLRNKKTGKSERTKELANRSSFLKESFQLITTRPKRRANSKASRQNEKLSKSKNIANQNEEIIDIKVNDILINTLSSNDVSSSTSYKLVLFKSDNNLNEDSYNIDSLQTDTKEFCIQKVIKKALNNTNLYKKSTLKHKIKNTDTNIVKKLNSEIKENFEDFGQLITKRLRTMDFDIARDTMHHIHNIIYEQQQNYKIMDLLDQSQPENY